MKPSDKKKFGRFSFDVTTRGLGTAPIGNQFRFVPEADARAVIDGAWGAGLRYFDTAPFYGHGLSEYRLGEGLRWRPRDEYILSSKVGRLLAPRARSQVKSSFWVDPGPFEVIHDYGYDATMRSFEDSLQRMGLERIDIAFIHDIDNFSHAPDVQRAHFRTAMDGAYKASAAMNGKSATRLCASATSIVSCSPDVTLCWSRTRSTRSCRYAKSAMSRSWSAAAITAAFSLPVQSKARITITASRPSRSSPACGISKRCAANSAFR
jgi:aryl-alcohol dehydrogenase-like predicted oxidoreductase